MNVAVIYEARGSDLGTFFPIYTPSGIHPNSQVTPMHILYLVLFFLLSCISSFAQLPPFRYIGIPEQHYPSGKVTFLNDRILVEDGGHFVYHVKSEKWLPLPNFDATYDRRMRLEVINDSLVGFDVYNEQGYAGYHVWNVDHDSMMFVISKPKGANVADLVDPELGYLQLWTSYTDYKILNITTTPFNSANVSQRTTGIPPGSQSIHHAYPCVAGGFWICTVEEQGRALWWTKTFDEYQSVARFERFGHASITHNWQHMLAVGSSETADTILLYRSPNEPPLRTIIDRKIYYESLSQVDHLGRVWNYLGGPNDGFYIASSEERGSKRVAGFEQRTRVITPFYINPDGSIMTATSMGLQISRDDSQTWTRIDRPKPSVMTIKPTAYMRIGEDGTLIIADSDLFWCDPVSASFERLPSEQSFYCYTWYHRGDAWLINGNIFRDERGLVPDTTKNVSSFQTFVWNDSIIVRWRSNPNTSKEETRIGTWTPGSDQVLHEDHLKRRFENVYSVKKFSNGLVYLGGTDKALTFSRDGTVESAFQTKFKTPNNNPLAPWIISENGDSLILIYAMAAFGSMPIDRLDTLVMGRREQVMKNVTKAIEGHDGRIIAIQSDTLDPDIKDDSLMIFEPDFRTFKIRRFENITESRVFNIAYDPINRVYYALTERGLYRSDPVVTSVASDDQRPAYDVLDPSAEIPLQTSWYTTLGQRIEPPTNSGVYLKIEFDEKGQMVTEKVLIP